MTFALLAPAGRARGDAYEGFDYPAGPASAPLNSGTGFLGSWPGGTPIAAGSLADPTGTLATTGNHLDDPTAVFLDRRLAQAMGASGSDVWVSWLQRSAQAAPGFRGLALAQPVPGGWTSTYFIGEPGSGPGDGTYVIGKAGDDLNVVVPASRSSRTRPFFWSPTSSSATATTSPRSTSTPPPAPPPPPAASLTRGWTCRW